VRTARVRVQLREAVPAVVRVLDVPASTTLSELHEILQAALGWTDSHLHQFLAGDRRYGVPSHDGWDAEELDETRYRLKDLPARFVYLYDFGDGWEHDIEVLGAGDAAPGCRDGAGGCPPEDCGGPGGYAHLRAVLADPRDGEYTEMRQWAGELAGFDLAATTIHVRRILGEVPASVRVLLELIDGGVTLTPGGRLPRAVVRAVQTQRPGWAWSGRPVTLEEDLPPLCALHDLLRTVGLARLTRGVLRPTRAAGDDRDIVRRLRSVFGPHQSFPALLATDAVALLAAHGPARCDQLAARTVGRLGHGWVRRDGRPVTAEDVRHELAGLLPELQALDQVEATSGTWRPGPSARTLLVRATALAQHWT